ncbi:uncharacterized protein E0L32_003401 [Thyridium curvatum]|uniref:Uncharacterized protein n=1 Tax=Thyridium curvatum TaxID=1093900 RepID=A0A507BHM1_9PEZI|nr:uncharacterized protein E0L32_003401 [Thyridium curvatum]TPX16839.1 hypothetical protein E0L32_003401 [Thyridium curvatum]
MSGQPVYQVLNPSYVYYPGNPPMICPVAPPLQQVQLVQQAQRVQPVLVAQPVQAAHVQFVPVAVTPTTHWALRPPGDYGRVVPPPPGRPGQWVQFADGQIAWVAPKQ